VAGRKVEPIEEALRAELRRGCESGVFPGASASVAFFEGGTWSAVEVAQGARETQGEPVEQATVYDLASLTKPWVAMTAVALHQTGTFDLDSRVSRLIPEADGLPVGTRPWDEVLSHRSGLDAWHSFYQELPHEPGTAAARKWILEASLPRWESERVGTSLYSDLGYILVGVALERASGFTLDALVSQRLAVPLGVEDEAFYASTTRGQSWVERCAPTGRSEWRGRNLVGEVHDDNCAALGGVAGHAGMFGTARAIRSFGCAWVAAWHGRRGALEEEAIRYATAERTGGSHRVGWDGKAREASSAGTRLGPRSFGHLGLTGTSIWCDPERELVVTLLSNRVAVSDDNAAIRAFRPRFHDMVVEAFDG